MESERYVDGIVERKQYYEKLEKTQRGNSEITEWILWFLQCLINAIDTTEETLSKTLHKSDFWKLHATTILNDRQQNIINRLLDGFDGKLTTSKWAKINKCSQDTARLMLKRIKRLLESGENFAFETTLSTRSYVQFVDRAKELDYQVTCLFFWLTSEELAISRVETRVKEGGHHIPEDVIRRRYKSGLKNFFNLFLEKVDNWLFVNNSGETYEIIAEGALNEETVNNIDQWEELKRNYYGN